MSTNQSAELARMQAEIAALKAANEALKANKPVPGKNTPIGEGLSARVSDKGAVSVYGIHSRFPITLYKNQWFKLFATMAQLRAFIESNSEKLSTKEVIEKVS